MRDSLPASCCDPLPFTCLMSRLLSLNPLGRLKNIAICSELKSKLMGYFEANAKYPNAQEYYYVEFPEHFVWKAKDKAWNSQEV